MACFRMGFVNLLLSVHSLVADFRNCAGFSDAGMTMPTTRTVAGVREAPRHEIAGSGHRRCGVRYGDLAAVGDLSTGCSSTRVGVEDMHNFGVTARVLHK